MKILTFDIEEWFHLLDHPSTESESQWSNFPSRIDQNIDRILGLLTDAQTSATFFCLGWIAHKYPHVIRAIADNGYEIACHSYAHTLAYKQTQAEFRADLLKAKSSIEEVTGVQVNTYRVPGFSLTEENLWVFDILNDLGFTVDCSVFPAARGHGGLPAFTTDQPCLLRLQNGSELKEFPLNTHSMMGNRFVFSGGGYFRLLPYSILKKLFTSHDYVMTYFHPRDFDPGQPVIGDLSLIRRFKSYYGLKEARSKLVKILQDFDFTDVQTAVRLIDWQSVERVEIRSTVSAHR
jgi:polysaccharide deacetylase family protein (PEP-CTERM system associated)